MFRGKKLNEIISDKRVLRVLVIIGLSAVALIGISSFFGSSGSDGTGQIKAYAEETERRLLEIVSRIDGVGEAEIYLTMDNAGESVYMKNSDKKTLSIEPRVRGVVVVCEGGDDPVVVSHVLEAVTKSLCISADKVCITK